MEAIGHKLTTKGQVTIPKEIRSLLGLESGDRVLFVRQGGEVLIRPLKVTLNDLRGSVTPRNRPEDFNEVRRQTRQRVARRNADV
ncbi:MAG: AbrB/MazE/SpoVT family DNA-binding domain-containing protein [Candidatus Poribacteria bacterium]|nr:AbrB/MazE/SpoVT family DNA-binding domain-containing protein [Candidatus Poribacteria bacterium]